MRGAVARSPSSFGRPAHRKSRARGIRAATPGGSGGGGGSEELGSLTPILYTRRVLLPTDVGTIRIYEPRYLDMFRSLGPSGIFGHCLHSSAVPEAMREGRFKQDGFVSVSVGAKGINVGCVCQAKEIVEKDDGELEVSYETLRRMTVESAYGACGRLATLQDDAFGEDNADLERELWEILKEIKSLSEALGRPSNLPSALSTVAPPEEKTAPPSRAFAQMRIWQKQDGQVRRPPSPPQVQSGGFGGSTSYEHLISTSSLRQELFAFAAASLVAETTQERLALVTSVSTRAKLHWTLSAAKPYVDQLRTERSIYRVMKDKL